MAVAVLSERGFKQELDQQVGVLFIHLSFQGTLNVSKEYNIHINMSAKVQLWIHISDKSYNSQRA